ncbi:MerR family transcriptional regulator [Flavobacterium celericrescens]|uniref:HTH merR-type domain-containing protein n=1 Tax=Flavobacterium celericrescens TaxID=2709780 RepID=A0ABX0ICE2_9FLAO|nr:MerR family transcriptional regulator [Flavobacterium celericrescens]NHM04853.1 hypothetical protein [Flavobacterium celericrescens]
MGLDIEKLKALQPHLDKKAREEQLDYLRDDLINLTLDTDIIESFRTEKTRKKTEQSKRVIGHWVKEGVIQGEQNSDGGWYHFNRIESIWIDIVTQLREFGLGLESLRKIRHQLFNDEVKGFKLIEYALMYSIIRKPYVMVVFPDGKINVLTKNDYSKTIEVNDLPLHLVLNFYNLAKKVFPNNNFETTQNLYSDNTSLTEDESKILFHFRTGDFDEIKIRMKDGSVYLVEKGREITNENKYAEILKNNDFADIEIKKQNGKICFIKINEKIKI